MGNLRTNVSGGGIVQEIEQENAALERSNTLLAMRMGSIYNKGNFDLPQNYPEYFEERTNNLTKGKGAYCLRACTVKVFISDDEDYTVGRLEREDGTSAYLECTQLRLLTWNLNVGDNVSFEGKYGNYGAFQLIDPNIMETK